MAFGRSFADRLADIQLDESSPITSTYSVPGPAPRPQNPQNRLHATIEYSEPEVFQTGVPSSPIDFDDHGILIPDSFDHSGDQTEGSEIPGADLPPVPPSPIFPLSPIYSNTQPFTFSDDTQSDNTSVASPTREEDLDGAGVLEFDDEGNEDGLIHQPPPLREDRASASQATKARAKGGSIQRPAKAVPQHPKRGNLPYIEFANEEALSKRASRRQKGKQRGGARKAPVDAHLLSNYQESKTDPISGASLNVGVPHPEQARLEERALDIYEKIYVNKQRPRRPPRPPPITLRFMSNTPSTPSSSPLSGCWHQDATERTIRPPAATNVQSSNWDPSPPSSPNDEFPILCGAWSWKRDPEAEINRRANNSVWVPNSTLHQQQWAPSVRHEAANKSPCVICFNIPQEFQGLASSSCAHNPNVCASCLEQHISHAVQDRGSTSVTCPDPGCSQALGYEDVLRGAKNNGQCIDRYETLLLQGSNDLSAEESWGWRDSDSW